MRTAWATIRAYPGRFVAVLLAIAIGVGFTAGTLIFTDSFATELTRSVGAAESRADVIVRPYASTDDPIDLDRYRAIDGVADAELQYQGDLQFSSAASRGYATLASVPQTESLRWYSLSSGSWPTGTDQILVDPDTATRNNLAVGDSVTVKAWGGDSLDVRVVGIADLGSAALLRGGDQYFGSAELAAAALDGYVDAVYLLATPGVDDDELAGRVRAALDPDTSVTTGAAAAAERIDRALTDLQLLELALLLLAGIAGVVAIFVVTNTFSILLAQRQRQVALLRCVGASRTQVRRGVLAEAALIGLLGAVAGVLLGLVVGWVGNALVGIAASSYTVGVVRIAVVVGIGVLVTVLAALASAARAMRVSPLAAMSPVPTMEEARSVGRLRLISGLVLLVGGGAVLAYGVSGSLLAAFAGGVISVVGVLILLRSALPHVLRPIAVLARGAGVPGRLAAANAERNPGRAAATSTALVIAVGLIVTLQVGAASARSSLDASTAEHYPLDVSVATAVTYHNTGETVQDPVPDGIVDQLSGVGGLTVLPMPGVSTEAEFDGYDEHMLLLGTPAGASSVIRAGDLAPGTVAVPAWMTAEKVVAVGDPLTFRSADGTAVTLTIVESRLATGQGMTAVTTAADLARLDPTPATMAIWGQLSDVDEANEVIGRVNRILSAFPLVQLSGAAAEHASVNDGLSTILLVMTALLAVAAVIAVVGIGNTLGLSVVERTRESALLRALGLRRGQLRLMLAVEAALLAAVGAAVGVLLGLGYGWAGAAALFAEADEPIVLSVPVGQLALVLALALVAGVLASVLPGRRAAQAAPTDALADV